MSDESDSLVEIAKKYATLFMLVNLKTIRGRKSTEQEKKEYVDLTKECFEVEKKCMEAGMPLFELVRSRWQTACVKSIEYKKSHDINVHWAEWDDVKGEETSLFMQYEAVGALFREEMSRKYYENPNEETQNLFDYVNSFSSEYMKGFF